jgi:hypothetical protein
MTAAVIDFTTGPHARRLAFGAKLHEQGRYQRAARIFASVDTPEAKYLLAQCVEAAGHTEHAAALLATVVAKRPEFVEARFHLAGLLNRLERRKAAEYHYRRVLDQDPTVSSAWLNLGNLLSGQLQWADALAAYEKARTLAPHDPRPLINLAHTKLLLGDYAEGWRLYHQRWALPTFRSRNGLEEGDQRKAWTGQEISGKRLLVFREQGTGDVLQMLRYDAVLREMGSSPIWRVPAHLWRLVKYSMPAADVVTDTERLPPHDYIVPVMSLPLLCGTDDINKIPKADGYLGLNLPTQPGADFSVGVAWAGSPHHKNDKARSITVEQMSELFGVPSVRFLNLQLGPREHEGDAYGLERVQISDYYDTARVLRGLDLVIGCDTSVVHLAGAMGVPCWVLVTVVPDWRWGLDREGSPWYRSVRVLRQLSSGDWAPVVEMARQRLTTARAAC